MPSDYVYDAETYRNMFSVGFYSLDTDQWWIFEISDRVNQTLDFVTFIYHLQGSQSRGVGFNNEGFDYPVIHHLMQIYEATGSIPIDAAWQKAQEIIHGNDRFGQMIWPSDRMFPQVDLFKIHHFDNFARSTSLKKLEVAMRSASVVDLPYDPMVDLTDEQKHHTIAYMCHDIAETVKFTRHSKEKIEFRDSLVLKYPALGDVVNFNDTKIGKKFFEYRMEQAQPGICYHKPNGRREPRQTIRPSIALGDVILPYVEFQHPELARVLDHLKTTVITETKGALSGLSATVDGFQFDFGTGGIHGSLRNQIAYSDDQHDIIDVDVTSYYPNLAIANGFYPEHLSQTFCAIYSELFEMRKQHGKKTAENAMLKLALNGVYGDSNSVYSPFFDPQYTMSITVNGQLLLAMLAEWLLKPGVEIIQANTDGLTFRVDKRVREWFMQVCKYWESVTKLKLEYADYDRMIIRDVNNYIAVKKDGGVKRIGDYAHETALENPYTRERQWHKDQSMLVVPKAAEAFLVDQKNIGEFIKTHRDPFDFMLMIKVQRNHSLVFENGTELPKITRYYVSTNGEKMFKVMPPLAATPDKKRKNAVQAGWKLKVVNDVSDFDWSDVNWAYYIRETEKLTKDIQIER